MQPWNFGLYYLCQGSSSNRTSVNPVGEIADRRQVHGMNKTGMVDFDSRSSWSIHPWLVSPPRTDHLQGNGYGCSTSSSHILSRAKAASQLFSSLRQIAQLFKFDIWAFCAAQFGVWCIYQVPDPVPHTRLVLLLPTPASATAKAAVVVPAAAGATRVP